MHRQAYGSRELTSLLSDFLFFANEQEVLYPKAARLYLEEWTEEGFLRQFYENKEERIPLSYVIKQLKVKE